MFQNAQHFHIATVMGNILKTRNYMNKKLFIPTIIIISIFFSGFYSLKYSEKNIITNDGFNQYKIGETKIDEIIQDYGNNFEKIDDRIWLYQIIYKELGLSQLRKV